MATYSNMATDQTSTVVLSVSDNRSAGALIGDTTAAKIAFYGATPVVRQTASSAVTGASDATAMSAAVTAIALTLKNLGLTN